jgi:hypothetical protein
VDFVVNGPDSDQGGCRENCTDIRTPIDCLPVSSPCCAKAAGIRRLLLEVQTSLSKHIVLVLRSVLDTQVFVYCAFEYTFSRALLFIRQDMPLTVTIIPGLHTLTLIRRPDWDSVLKES